MKRLDYPGDPAPFAKVLQLPDGQAGSERTLELAAGLVAAALDDPVFPLWAREAILSDRVFGSPVDTRDAPAVFARIYDYVVGNVRFQPDPLVYSRSNGAKSITDYIQSPHYTLFIASYGDCLSLASAIDSMSLALGHGAAYRSIKGDPSDPSRFSHAYALLGYSPTVGMSDVWLPADATIPERGFGYEALGDSPTLDWVIAEAN